MAPGLAFTSLAHHMDIEWLHEAHRRTRKDGAAGVDGQNARDYEAHLEANLRSLLDRAKSGDRYKAPPVRRVHIPKGDGSTRPLGIPTFEDKILQRAVVMLLEPLYEQDFKECSMGFRPGRSAHQALKVVWDRLMNMGGGWVLDVDIRKYFDTLDHSHLRDILSHRMRDGVVKRLVGKWLNAGVLEDGCISHPEAGTPQGGVISPLLANLYLHEVLDVWFEREVMPRLKGQGFMVRYADDFIMGFGEEEDARRVLAVLSKRFGKFGLTLHPEKTRLLDFRRPRPCKGPEDGDPGSFDFLGFNHHWEKTRKGARVIRQRTAKSRFTRSIARVQEWLRRNRHLPVGEQHQTLCQKLKGHCGYFGITGNSRSLARFRWEVMRVWKKWLSRRSQKAWIDWPAMGRLMARYPLPFASPVHSTYTSQQIRGPRSRMR
jgi:group II intron reverse transcriptase/maturase